MNIVNQQLMACIVDKTKAFLDQGECLKLELVLREVLDNYLIQENDRPPTNCSNDSLIKLFLDAKNLEGCSQKTCAFYKKIMSYLTREVTTSFYMVKTRELRDFLTSYQNRTGCSNCTLDNMRKVYSSFFTWLEEENYIIKSPMKAIHIIKGPKHIKDTFSPDEIENLMDSCHCDRDLAIMNLLLATGMRIGELVRIDRYDVDFDRREIKVLGKGSKERLVYFDYKTKLILKKYLRSRSDKEDPLFVCLRGKGRRISINGIESRLRKMGRKNGVSRIYPHKFRRTMATKGIAKGMTIENMKTLLGHNQLETTMTYVVINQNNVKNSYDTIIA